MKAITTPQFDWFPRWIQVDPTTAVPNPTDKIASGLTQPGTVQVSFTSERKELQAHIVPDQGIFGVEFYLAFTLPDFKLKILGRIFPETRREDGENLFHLMELCLQHSALATWREVVTNRSAQNGFVKNAASFLECQRDYLEAIAEFPRIGDQLIRWFRSMKKPALMNLHDFAKRRKVLYGYLESGLLRHDLAIPAAQERSEQIFFAMPRAHQHEYCRNNEDVSLNTNALITFFERCAASDKNTGVLAAIEAHKKTKGDQDDQKPSSSNKRSDDTTRKDRRAQRYRNHKPDTRNFDRDGRGSYRSNNRNYSRDGRDSRRSSDFKYNRNHDRKKGNVHGKDTDKDQKKGPPGKRDHAMHADQHSRSPSVSGKSSKDSNSSSSVSSKHSYNAHMVDQQPTTTAPVADVTVARQLDYSDDDAETRGRKTRIDKMRHTLKMAPAPHAKKARKSA